MSACTQEILKQLLDLCVSGVGVVRSCSEVGIQSPSTFFAWQARSKKAEQRNDFSSPFYLKDGWGGEDPDYWHRYLLVARARRTLLLEGEIIEAAALNQPGPIVIQDGKVCWAENEDFIGMSDEEMEGLGYDPVKDRIARDKLGRPVPLRHSPVPAPATLRAKAIASLHPTVWGEKQEITSNTNIHQRVEIVGSAVVLERKGAPAPDESESIKQMRERLLSAARAHLTDPPRVTRPTDKVRMWPSDAGTARMGDKRERVDQCDPMDDVDSRYRPRLPAPTAPEAPAPGPSYRRVQGLNTDDLPGRNRRPPPGGASMTGPSGPRGVRIIK